MALGMALLQETVPKVKNTEYPNTATAPPPPDDAHLSNTVSNSNDATRARLQDQLQKESGEYFDIWPTMTCALENQHLMYCICILNHMVVRLSNIHPRASWLNYSTVHLLAKHIKKYGDKHAKSAIDKLNHHCNAKTLPHATLNNWFLPETVLTFGNKTYTNYTKLAEGWDVVDFLMPQSDKDEHMRYTAHWAWSDNSCALDALVGLSIQMNAWRTRADQHHWPSVTNAAVHWLRNIARLPWGLATPEGRASLRETLRRIIASLSHVYPAPNERRSVEDTFEIMFDKLPQVSSYVVTREFCCSLPGRLKRVQDRCYWQVSHNAQGKGDKITIKELLLSVFQETETELLGTSQCCLKIQGEKCTHVRSIPTVCGRLSPVIVLSQGRGYDQVDMQDPGEIQVQYAQIDTALRGGDIQKIASTAQSATYTLQAVVYQLKDRSEVSSDPGHFVLGSKLQAAKTGGKIVMDMMNNPKKRVAPFPDTGTGKETWSYRTGHPVLLVFKLMGTYKP